MRRALSALVVVCAVAALPGRAEAYDHQLTFDFTAGWGLSPAIVMEPDHGPMGGVGLGIGFDDTWGLGFVADWAVHPPFTDNSDPLQVGLFGVEGLYYIDILEIVPFFGVGVDFITTFDGVTWRGDFAAHVRVSVDYLVSRDIAVGIDVRPYILFTNLSLDPVYISAQARLSILLPY